MSDPTPPLDAKSLCALLSIQLGFLMARKATTPDAIAEALTKLVSDCPTGEHWRAIDEMTKAAVDNGEQLMDMDRISALGRHAHASAEGRTAKV